MDSLWLLKGRGDIDAAILQNVMGNTSFSLSARCGRERTTWTIEQYVGDDRKDILQNLSVHEGVSMMYELARKLGAICVENHLRQVVEPDVPDMEAPKETPEKVESEVESLKRELQTANSAIHSYDVDLKELRKAYNVVIEKLVEAEKSSSEEEARLRKDLANARREVMNLQAKCSDFRSNYDIANIQLKGAKDDLEKITKDRDALREGANRLQSELDSKAVIWNPFSERPENDGSYIVRLWSGTKLVAQWNGKKWTDNHGHRLTNVRFWAQIPEVPSQLWESTRG